MRSLGSISRSIERESRRRQRELEKQSKLLEKMQEQERAAYEAQVYENNIELLSSVYKECGDICDWASIQSSPPPSEPTPTHTHEEAAREELASQKIGLSDKLLGRDKNKREILLKAVEDAKNTDEEEYRNAIRSYEEEYAKWDMLCSIAGRILAHDKNAYLDAIQVTNPFSDLNDLGSFIEFEVETPSVMNVTIQFNNDRVIPSEVKSLLKSGKLSIKPMPKGKSFEIYQDYVCGSALRIARELFALLPLKYVIVTAMGRLLNTKTGHMDESPILSVLFPKETIESLNFETLDPSDSMSNFIHRMNFKKNKGFEAVERIRFSELETIQNFGN